MIYEICFRGFNFPQSFQHLLYNSLVQYQKARDELHAMCTDVLNEVGDYHVRLEQKTDELKRILNEN
jgi:hypothetical protein